MAVLQNAAEMAAPKMMAGVTGFEPVHDGIKTRCLTAWLHPIRKLGQLII